MTDHTGRERLFDLRRIRLDRRRGAAVAALASLGVAAIAIMAASPAGASTTWSPSGACGVVQTTTVPANVYEMTLDVSGGNGGQGAGQSSGTTSPGGTGAHVNVSYSVAPGDVISAIIGCNGSNGSSSSATAGAAGWSTGGGTGEGQNTIFDTDGAGGGAGGGSSAVCLGLTCTAGLSTPLVVAGGAGGSGSSSCAGTTGGAGGNADFGTTYSSVNNGTGLDGGNGGVGASSGSQNTGISGGAGGVNATLGNPNGGTSPNGSGGADVNVVGGGGGGGYVGGGAGADASTGCEAGGAGGAGSSWYSEAYNGSLLSDLGSGGAVLVTFSAPTLPTTTTLPPTTVGPPLSWAPSGACGTTSRTVVPAGVFSMTVDLSGGNGGAGGGQSSGTTGSGGTGGQVAGTFNVTPGSTISAVVGCNGTNGDGGNSDDPTPTSPGWSAGGGTGQGSNTALFPTGAAGGGGGGSSAVCLGAFCVAGLSNPLAVAGGAGGSGSSSCAGTTGGNGGFGGAGGTTSVSTGYGPSGDVGGSGATSGSSNSTISGGAGGVNSTAGAAAGASAPDGSGGDGVNVVGGGGGGGYVGGAAGSGAAGGCEAGAAGGGGSSWVSNNIVGSPSFSPGTEPMVEVNFAAPVLPAPTIGAVTPGNASATVNWTAPSSDGGSPLTGYVVTAIQNGSALTPQIFLTTTTHETVTGLTNGLSYTFTVAAINVLATGLQSAASNPVVVGVPGQPVLQQASPGNASAKVSWYGPASNGAPINSYQIIPYISGVAQAPQSFPTSANSDVVTGLTNGTSYTFRIIATNVYGNSATSNPTAAVMIGVPGQPVLQQAAPGNASAKVSWYPAAANGSAITSYTITPYIGTVAQPAQTFLSSANSETVTGLTNGTSYTFKIAATNSYGTGAVSAATTAVVIGTPAAPVSPQASSGDSAATVSWTAPAAGGSPITQYQVTPYIGTTAQTPSLTSGPTPTSLTVTGLTDGTSYTFKVVAINTYGTGPAATTAALVDGTPGKPTLPRATTGNASATVAFVAAAANGGAITSYTITPYIGTAPQDPQTFGTATSDVMTGLNDGTTYTFKIYATNSFGNGVISNPTTAVTIGVPAPPHSVTAVAGTGQATVKWAAPANNGTTITSYTVTPYLNGVAQAPQTTAPTLGTAPTTLVVTGLTSADSYTFTVVATNENGSSLASSQSTAITVN